MSKRNKYWDRTGPLAQLLESLLKNNNIPAKLSTAAVQRQFTQFADIPEKNFSGILSRYRSKYCSSTIAKIISLAENRKKNIKNKNNTIIEAVDTPTEEINNNLLENNNNNINKEESNFILSTLSK